MHYYLISSDVPLGHYCSFDPELLKALAKVTKKTYPNRTALPQVISGEISQTEFKLFENISQALNGFRQGIIDEIMDKVERNRD
ncbi:hypothetical protein C4588_03660 [Candidatus Parcubacteria bacterium]|nr:MAG: hypothetical protein C4588_03660 [Candidatus Parcubacteria bacterium]